LADETILVKEKGTMNPDRLETESAEYRKLRDELHDERVAALRRKLPLDTGIQDYEFHEGPAGPTKDGPFAIIAQA
jgi:hypothetical protein